MKLPTSIQTWTLRGEGKKGFGTWRLGKHANCGSFVLRANREETRETPTSSISLPDSQGARRRKRSEGLRKEEKSGLPSQSLEFLPSPKVGKTGRGKRDWELNFLGKAFDALAPRGKKRTWHRVAASLPSLYFSRGKVDASQRVCLEEGDESQQFQAG